MTAPQNMVMVQGQTVASADYLNTLVQWVPNFDVLRAFIGTGQMTVLVLGKETINDGGQGIFTWSDFSTAPDDDEKVIVPQGVSSGAWIRAAVAPTPVIIPPGGTVNVVPGGVYVASGPFTANLPPSKSISPDSTMQFFAYGGPITLNPAPGDLINGSANPLVIPKGYSSTVYTDGKGNYFATIVPSSPDVLPTVTVPPGGVTTGSGGGNTIIINTNGSFKGIVGQFLFFTATANNTGWTTIDAGTGPIGVVKNLYTGISGLTGGEIIAGNYYLVAFNGQYFDLINPTPGAPASILATSPATVSIFRAEMKSGQQLHGIAIPPKPATLIPLPSAPINQGGNFLTQYSGWYPPQGWIWIHGQLGFSAGEAADCSIQIWKNWPGSGVTGYGVMIGQTIRHLSANATDGINTLSVQMIDFAQAGSVYSLHATHTSGTGYVTMGGGGQGWFMGHMI